MKPTKGCIGKMAAVILALALVLGGLPVAAGAEGSQTNVKTRSTYYTPEKIAAARQNIEKYDWAKNTRDAAVALADKYLQLGNDYLWDYVTTHGIPRSYAYCVQGSKQFFNCPNCGAGIKPFGNYPWLADPLNEPWKLECPNCHMKFPTNDFGAYYKSGLDEHGNFVPDLADKSLLKNTLYPEKGESWGVDDGFGFVDGDYKYTFVAYYNHWWVWYGKSTDYAVVEYALNALRDAYIYTGDMKYARTGAILLDRVADVYPTMDTFEFPVSTGFLQSDGGIGGHGNIVGCIWETGLVKDFIRAYDAFFPAFDDPEIISYLSGKASQYNMANPKKTAADIRKNIEDGIVREVYPGVMKSDIRGNNGMHQSALALAAVVLDTMPETKEWLDFNFQAGSFVSSVPKVTGGNILATLVNDVDRDGHGNESAPGYNKIWLSQYLEVANILEGYDLYPSADLYNNVKFRKMFTAMYPLMLTDNLSANIGDSSSAGSPTNYAVKTEIIKAFEKYGAPELAQVAYYLNGNTTEGIHGDIFSSDPEGVANSIEEVIEEYGTLKLGSTNLTGYGFTALRDQDSADAQRSVWMYYGRNTGHGHKDTLNLGLTAFKLDLSPDLGYPEAADALNAHRSEWMNNTISHNTVVVDNAKQKEEWVGQPKHFDDSGMVKLVDVEAPKVYPQTDLYRRTTAMIKVDGQNSYAVDFFRVSGGSDHNFSFHGPEGEVTTEGLNLTVQPTGTYAGADIDYPGNDYKYTGASGYTGSGYQWLKNVERDMEPSALFSVDWKAKDTWNIYGNGAKSDTDVHLRLTMLGSVDDVAIADGTPAQNRVGNPASIKYLVAHRNGENLDSLFTSVLEPYKEQRFIESIAPVDVKTDGQVVSDGSVAAVKVTLADGRVDYVINSLNPDITYSVDNKLLFKGFFGVYSEKDGEQVGAYLNDGTILGSIENGAQSCVKGVIAGFTKEMSSENSITTLLYNSGVDASSLVGKYIYVENDGVRNASYQIKGIKSVEGQAVTFDIGDATTIRSWADVNDFSKGYIYDIAEGVEFDIPLSVEYKVSLAQAAVTADKNVLTRTETANLAVAGKLNTGKDADLSNATIEYTSSNPEVAAVNNGVVTANNAGTAEITAEVTLNGVTVESRLTITVNATIASIRSMIDTYKASDELKGPLVPQLENSLAQAEHQLDMGAKEQAAKLMEDFIKHLNNAALEKNVSDEAKAVLNSDALALIASWK